MKYVAFLRAINVGGHVVKMEALRAHFVSLGFSDVETFIASGNVVFESAAKPATIARKIEAHLHDMLGYDVATFIRTLSEVHAIARFHPFDPEAAASAGALCVGFLEHPLDAAACRTLMQMKTPIDEFHVHGREVYWLCVKKQSESTFSNAKFERALKVRATFRGANTVARLATKYPI
ncbi:MAG: DUF1697 domain-containing protein [Usitatibacteraceae bacterium]